MRKRPREWFTNRFRKITISKAKKFVDFMKDGEDGRLPCWGSAIEYIDEEFKTDRQRIAIWPAFVESDDWRAQLLFINICRTRPAVIEEILKDVDKLPIHIQRAIVSMDELKEQIEPQLSNFHPAASQLAEAEPEVLERERQVVGAKIGKYVGMRYFRLPQSSSEEGGNNGQ